MISLFKPNPAKRLRKRLAVLQKEAMELQRNGDIKGYAIKTEQAKEVEEKILALKGNS